MLVIVKDCLIIIIIISVVFVHFSYSDVNNRLNKLLHRHTIKLLNGCRVTIKRSKRYISLSRYVMSVCHLFTTESPWCTYNITIILLYATIMCRIGFLELALSFNLQTCLPEQIHISLCCTYPFWVLSLSVWPTGIVVY